jgi:DNA-binding NtrC family response regulator
LPARLLAEVDASMAHILIAHFTATSQTLDDLRSALEVARPGEQDTTVVAGAVDAADLVATIDAARPGVVILVAGSGPLAERVFPALGALTASAWSPSAVVAASGASAAEVAGALTLGAREFLGLPLNITEASGRLRCVLGGCIDRTPGTPPVPGFVGENPALLDELNKIPIVAGCDANVLITGETGTGKELCAQAIHALSLRREKAFVAINCGAIPPDLVENELFGHERGAFTGASNGRPGLVHEADGGTLFLDEINSLPLSAQVKLLRLLQDGTFRSLGSTRLQRANLRTVAATNDDLKAGVAAGRFRQDLYYRLNVIPLHVPALRDRRDDIPRLAQFFVRRYAGRMGKRVHDLAPDALTKLSGYAWPGNVRELEHAIERAVVLSHAPILRACDISVGTDASPEQTSFHHAKARVVSEFERGYLRSILSQHHGNISHAAVAAGKDRRALWELLRKHAIDPQAYRAASRLDEPRMAS